MVYLFGRTKQGIRCEQCKKTASDAGYHYYSFQAGTAGGCYYGDQGTPPQDGQPGDQGYMMYGPYTGTLMKTQPDNSGAHGCFIDGDKIYGNSKTNAVYEVINN